MQARRELHVRAYDEGAGEVVNRQEGMMEGKKRMFRVERPDVANGRFCVFRDSATLADAELENGEIGETIIVKIVEMTDAEFEALGEFEGW